MSLVSEGDNVFPGHKNPPPGMCWVPQGTSGKGFCPLPGLSQTQDAGSAPVQSLDVAK